MTAKTIITQIENLDADPSRENCLALSYTLVEWMGITPTVNHIPRLKSASTQTLRRMLVYVPQMTMGQLYRLTAENSKITVRFAVLKKLKGDYIERLINNDVGLRSFQAAMRGIIQSPGREAYIASNPYYIHFVATPGYAQLHIITNNSDQYRVITLPGNLSPDKKKIFYFNGRLFPKKQNRRLRSWFGKA